MYESMEGNIYSQSIYDLALLKPCRDLLYLRRFIEFMLPEYYCWPYQELTQMI